eukprot:15459361-Alexandrium_andersonii.AAC.1
MPRSQGRRRRGRDGVCRRSVLQLSRLTLPISWMTWRGPRARRRRSALRPATRVTRATRAASAPS